MPRATTLVRLCVSIITDSINAATAVDVMDLTWQRWTNAVRTNGRRAVPVRLASPLRMYTSLRVEGAYMYRTPAAAAGLRPSPMHLAITYPPMPEARKLRAKVNFDAWRRSGAPIIRMTTTSYKLM